MQTTTRMCDNRPNAFTLIELVLSMAITTALLGGISAAIFLAGRAVPDGRSLEETTVRTADIADQIAADLYCSLWFQKHVAKTAKFTVPDRDGDGLPDKIRYRWSGTAGDPLTRTFNDGTAVEVLPDVREFEVTYELASVDEEYPGPPLEGAEQVLSSHGSINGYFKSFAIEKDKWPGQYFKPSLPGDAVAWRVTRVHVYVKADGPSETALIQLRPANADYKPTNIVLEEFVMNESALHDWYDWFVATYADVKGLAPGTGLCLVLKNSTGGGKAGLLAYDEYGGSGGINTKDYGATWSYFSNLVRLYYIYGTISTPGPTQTATRQYVTNVRVALRAGDDPNTRVVTATQTLNAPELLDGLWELNFDSDPRQDHNGDGNDDWAEWEGSFDPVTLVDGIWYAPHLISPRIILNTAPDEGFNKLTTVDISFRTTSVTNWGATFRINADWQDGPCAPLIAMLSKPDSSSQELWIGNVLPNSSTEWLYRLSDLSNDFVRLRLLIDPTQGTIAVFNDGSHVCTCAYTWGYSHSDAMAWIYSENATAEFDYVSIRANE